MVSYVSALLYGVGGLVVAGMTLLVALQERLVYVPVLPGLTKSYPITPARLRLTYEDVWLRSSDGVRLHAWFIKLFPLCRGPTLLFFQENAGNIAHRLEMVRIMLQQLQCNVFMLSYRGYMRFTSQTHYILWSLKDGSSLYCFSITLFTFVSYPRCGGKVIWMDFRHL
ncbi:unnamed protein product [Malus baccata var. baccata]